MRQKMWVCFLVFFFWFGLKLAWAEAKWWPGIIHAHSTFSDGSKKPEALVKEAKKAGVSFLIATDHYEQIDSISTQFPFKFEKKKGSWIADDHGFDNYRDRFSKLASSDFVIIAGAEITTYWNDAASHLLALGDLVRDEDLMKRHGQKDTQQAVINRVNGLGLLSVAAHPSLTALRYEQWRGDFKNYQFDPDAKGFKGIEFFNDEPEGYNRTRDLWYLMRLRRGDDVFVTSGCDSHGWKDVYDDDRWRRKTWVWSEKLDKESLLQEMAQGHTYAAQHGASLENLNYIPGFQAKEVERPKFQFFAAFDKKITSSKTIRIYRDGKLIESSVQAHKKENIEGLQKIAYVWEDKEAKEGEHNYVIEVEGVLITSPIKLKVGGTSKEVDTGNILGAYAAKGFEDAGFLELRKDNICLLASLGKWIIKVKQVKNAFTGAVSSTRFTVTVMMEPLRATEDEGDHDRIIMSEPLQKRAGSGKQLISLNTMFVGYIEGETIKEQQSEDKLIRDKRAVLIKSSEGKLWSSYLVQKGKASFEFKEDGRVCLYTFGKWEIKDDALTIQLVFGDEEISLKGKIKDSTLEMEGGIFVKKEEEKSLR